MSHVVDNRQIYRGQVDSYRRQHYLEPAEIQLLAMFRGRWHEMDVLDLGVGAGRTAGFFAPVSRSYVGIDYADEMVQACKQDIGESEGVRFLTCDARAMPFDPASFDLAIFSYNGLDYVDHEARREILREIRRVMRPGGHFMFSSHSLHAFPFKRRLPELRLRRPIRSLESRLGTWLLNRRVAGLNRGVDRARMEKEGHAVLCDFAYPLRTYYVYPKTQMRQLEDAGFRTLRLIDRYGEAFDPEQPTRHEWVHFLCTTSARPGV